MIREDKDKCKNCVERNRCNCQFKSRCFFRSPNNCGRHCPTFSIEGGP